MTEEKKTLERRRKYRGNKRKEQQQRGEKMFYKIRVSQINLITELKRRWKSSSNPDEKCWRLALDWTHLYVGVGRKTRGGGPCVLLEIMNIIAWQLYGWDLKYIWFESLSSFFGSYIPNGQTNLLGHSSAIQNRPAFRSISIWSIIYIFSIIIILLWLLLQV